MQKCSWFSRFSFFACASFGSSSSVLLVVLFKFACIFYLLNKQNFTQRSSQKKEEWNLFQLLARHTKGTQPRAEQPLGEGSLRSEGDRSWSGDHMSLSIDLNGSGKRYMQISLIKYSNEAQVTFEPREGCPEWRQLRLQFARSYDPLPHRAQFTFWTHCEWLQIALLKTVETNIIIRIQESFLEFSYL